MRRILFILPVIAILLLLPASCKEDSEPYPTKYWAVDIVTLQANSSQIGMRFNLQRNSRAEKINLYAAQYLDTLIPRGTRVLISYEAELADTSRRPMPISLLGISFIAFDTVRQLPIKNIEALAKPQLSIVSCWQADGFINFQADLQYDGNSREFSLVADENTVGKPLLECYLYNTGKPVSENFIDRRNYGSFFAGELLSLPEVEKIRIYTDGADNKNSHIDLELNPN